MRSHPLASYDSKTMPLHDENDNTGRRRSPRLRPGLCLAIMIPAWTFLSASAAAETIVTLLNGRQLRGIRLPPQGKALRLRLPSGIELTLDAPDIRAIEENNGEAYILRRLGEASNDYALDLIEDSLAANPDSTAFRSAARTLWLHAAAGRAAERPAAAQALYSKVAALFPHDSKAQAGLAACEAALDKLAQEADGLRRLVAERPGNDLARFDLGRVYEKLGRPDAAFAEYKRIIHGKIDFTGGVEQIDELRALIANALVETPPPAPPPGHVEEPRGAWASHRTGRFIIRYHQGTAVAPVAEAAEAAMSRALAALKGALPEAFAMPRVHLTVYATEREYRAATGERIAPALSRPPASVFSYEGAPHLQDNLLPHELMHLALHRAVGPQPLWLDEGLAVRQEAMAGLQFARLKQLAAAGQAWPLAAVLSEAPAQLAARSGGERDAFYAAAFALVQFLVQKGGVPKLLDFARGAAQNGLANALQQHYGFSSVAVLERAWAAFAQY